jgi:hypothetical protein
MSHHYTKVYKAEFNAHYQGTVNFSDGYTCIVETNSDFTLCSIKTEKTRDVYGPDKSGKKSDPEWVKHIGNPKAIITLDTGRIIVIDKRGDDVFVWFGVNEFLTDNLPGWRVAGDILHVYQVDGATGNEQNVRHIRNKGEGKVKDGDGGDGGKVDDTGEDKSKTLPDVNDKSKKTPGVNDTNKMGGKKTTGMEEELKALDETLALFGVPVDEE